MGLTITSMRVSTGGPPAGAPARRLLLLAALALLTPAPSVADSSPMPAPVRDLHYREVLFHHYQQDYFHALTTLLAGQERDRVDPGNADAGLLRVGIELSYGMHESALTGFEELIGRGTAPQMRDRIRLSLARTWARRGYPERASDVLERIDRGASPDISAERALLAADISLQSGDERGALARLEGIDAPPVWSAYARYNRMMLMARLGIDGIASAAPAAAKRGEPVDPELRSLHDHAHVALGLHHLNQGRLAEAEAAFARVDAESVVAGQARLGEAQAAYDRGDLVGANRLWSSLVEGHAPGPVVREAMLMRVDAQRRHGSREEAVAAYRTMMAGLDRESAELARMIADVSADPSFLAAIGSPSRAEAARDALPSPYRSAYLRALAADDDFHEAWSAWRQLHFLRERLDAWTTDITAFDHMLDTRREGYAQRLPEAEKRLAALDIDTLRARVAGYVARVDDIAARGDAAALANAGENGISALIADIESRLSRPDPDGLFNEHRERLRILKGVLLWNIEHDFKARLWRSRKGVMALDAEIARVEEGRARLVLAREEAPARFTGFDHRIADAQARITTLSQRLAGVAARHEAYIKGLVIAELEQQRQLAAGAAARARYELATLLDEMTVAAADGEWQAALDAWIDFNSVAVAEDQRLHALRRIADMRLMLADALTADHPARSGELRAAIDIYENLLLACASCPGNDGIHYQLARAYDALDEPGRSLDAMNRIAEDHPDSPLQAEIRFRLGEILFVQRRYVEAEQAYAAVGAVGDSPFRLQARYKHGWSLFKQTRYDESVDDFIAVLDDHLVSGAGDEVIDPEALPAAERSLVTDTLRVIGLAFSHLDGPDAVAAYFASRPPVAYEHLVFAGLADHYLEKERYSDAARTFDVFILRNPGHSHAVASQIRIIDIHEQAGFGELALQARRDLLERFGIASVYWKHNDIARMPEVAERLRQELLAMAERTHARAQAGDADASQEAARWYREYLAWFPDDARAPQLSFLLGELLFESGDYAEAIARYEQSAYHYGSHEQATEAGYAALLSYDRLIAGADDDGQKAAWQEQAVVSALLFADRFPGHPETPAVLARSAEHLFRQGHTDDALTVALRVTAYGETATPALRQSAWMLIGQVRFDRSNYSEAEHAFVEAIALLRKDDPARPGLVERQAAAIYQQGRLALDGGQPLDAAAHFLRIAQLAPGASIIETAEYDAATALLAGGSRTDAIIVLERFRRDWPASRWTDDVGRKLYFAYLDEGRLARAADELIRLEAGSSDPEEARAAAWQSAELYERAGMSKESLQRYQHYVSRWPEPLDQAVEARLRIAGAYLALGNEERHRHWLGEVVAADTRAGGSRTDFSRESAAGAVLTLAEPLRRQFEDVRLVTPLDRSLKAKRAAMDSALKAYRSAADYGVADVTTAATFYIGEIYHELSRALLASQRPAGLSEEELEQYDILLEEQAYPFEEEAIKLHEVNYRRIADGIYDDWVKRSIEQLGSLLPARYGKAEILVSIVETIH